MQEIRQTDPAVTQLIEQEQDRQAQAINLIAAENYVSPAVLEALGSVLTNKYSEGYPGKRYYAGNQWIDEIENLAIDRARSLFGAEHANVQPLSGTPANLAVYTALLQPGDTILGLALDHGGHLTHGHQLNFSGKYFNVITYHTDRQTGLIDMEEVRQLAKEHRPKLIIAGFSAYPRNLDWAAFADIAHEVGAVSMADIAHIAGLIAGGVLPSPVPYFDIVTTTTHKTLRGPRGGLILCKKEFSPAIDRAVFPGVQGGPHDNITAAKAVCLAEAATDEFKVYARQVLTNAQALSTALTTRGFKLVSGGTDNHLMLVDVVASRNLTGQQAEVALNGAGIIVNRNMIPFDERKPLDPSGIRLGTPAMTTRGLQEKEMNQIAAWLDEVLSNPTDETQQRVRSEVEGFVKQYPVPSLGLKDL